MVTPPNRRMRPGLRGEEAEARWRIRTGTWGARVLAVVLAVPALAALIWPGQAAGADIVFLLTAAAVALVASERLRRGSRTAAVVLLAGFVTLKLLLWLTGYAPLLRAWLLSAVLIFCLAQGVWGTVILARVRRERAAADLL
jgi:TctA family transporter